MLKWALMKKRVFKNNQGLLVLLLVSLVLNLYFLLEKELSNLPFFKEKTIFKARVVRVVDGDTFDLEGARRVRLAGIDAPEYPKGCLAQETKERLEELVLGKEVKVEEVKKDNFGRSVAFVFVKEVFVNRVLVEEGLAKARKADLQYSALLLERQEEAKRVKRGIWSSLCLPKEGCVIKGNVRRDRGTRIYHLPECFNWEKIVVNEKEGDRWFCSEEEAKSAGFVKSKDCP